MDKWELEARKRFIEALLSYERKIGKLNQSSVDRIAAEIKRRASDGTLYAYLEQLSVHLKNEAARLESDMSKVLNEGITVTVSAGAHHSKQVTLSILNKASIDWKPIERTYASVNSRVVDTMRARTIKGLNLSDRIWKTSRNTMDSIGQIIEESIRQGMNPIELPELLEGYVRNGAHTFASDYPNMFDRISVSMDLNYESLRLARTEMAAAYGDAKKESAKINPANKGMQWRVSNAGVTCELCKDNANHDSGLGKGIYKLEDLPEYPAHPNCLCIISEVLENTDDLVDRLIEWNKNPLSQPDIEKWYQNVYRQGGVA